MAERPVIGLLCVHPTGEFLGQHWRCAGSDEVVVGRTANAEIQINSRTFGRRHFRLRHRDGGWQVAHMGSTNGTRVYRDQRDARSETDAVDAWTDTRVEVRPGTVINAGDLFFLALLEADDDTVLRHRLRLRVVDWLTGALRADAFSATLPWLAGSQLVRVDFEPVEINDWTWGPAWLAIAATLIRTYSGVGAIVGFAPPAGFVVAATDTHAIEQRLRKAFDGPWLSHHGGGAVPRAIIGVAAPSSTPLPAPQLNPTLSAIDLPQCLECQGPLNVAESREGRELFACTRCGGMFELDALVGALSHARTKRD